MSQRKRELRYPSLGMEDIAWMMLTHVYVLRTVVLNMGDAYRRDRCGLQAT